MEIVIGALELGLLGHGLGVLASGVQVAVDRDPALLVIVTLGVKSLGGGGPELLRCLVLLVVRIEFEEESGQRVSRLINDFLTESDSCDIDFRCVGSDDCESVS